MGASGSWGDAPASEDLAALLGIGAVDPKALRAKVLQSSLRGRVSVPTPQRIVAQGVPQNTPQMPQNLGQQAPDYLKQYNSIGDELSALNAPTDTTALAAEGKRRGEQGTTDMLMALAAQQAGPGFEAVQQSMLKQAMAARDPMKFSGGIVNDQGQVVEDPNFKIENKRRTLEGRQTALERTMAAQQAQAAALAAKAEEGARQRDMQAQIASGNQAIAAALAQSRIEKNAAGPAEKPAKPMPAGMQKAWLENRNNLNAVDRAIAVSNAYPDAFGPSNVIGDFAKQYTDPKGVAARAAVADIGSLKIHDRSGAAVTAMEFPRLRPFIPQATDKPEVVKTKLDNFKSEYNAIQDEIATFAEDQGYKAPSMPATAPAAPAAAAGGWTVKVKGQ